MTYSSCSKRTAGNGGLGRVFRNENVTPIRLRIQRRMPGEKKSEGKMEKKPQQSQQHSFRGTLFVKQDHWRKVKRGFV